MAIKNIIYDEEFEIGHGNLGIHAIPIHLEHQGKFNHKLHMSIKVKSDDPEQDIIFWLVNEREFMNSFSSILQYSKDSLDFEINTEYDSDRLSSIDCTIDITESQTMFGLCLNTFSQLTDKIIHAKIYETWDDDVSKNSVFVITPIGDSENEESWNIIKSECQKLNLKPERANSVIGSKSILENIVAKIKQSEFLIVDLTCEKPNVYCELGYAHGQLKKEENILLIAKKDTILHFDISPSNVEFYKSVSDLHDIIYNKMKHMMS